MRNNVSSYVRLERSREMRLWVTQVVIPGIVIGSYILANNPELTEKIKTKYNNLTDKAKRYLKGLKKDVD